MDVTPLIRRDTKVIQSYRGGEFKISNQQFKSAVIVTASHVAEWPQGNADVLSLEDFGWLAGLAEPVEVVLLGTGERQVIPPASLRRSIKERYNVSLEAMDTGAASRTYNVLVAEGRLIAAALKPF